MIGERSSAENLPSDEQHMKRMFLEAVAFSFSLQEKPLEFSVSL
jgi:hypothetical protein